MQETPSLSLFRFPKDQKRCVIRFSLQNLPMFPMWSNFIVKVAASLIVTHHSVTVPFCDSLQWWYIKPAAAYFIGYGQYNKRPFVLHPCCSDGESGCETADRPTQRGDQLTNCFEVVFCVYIIWRSSSSRTVMLTTSLCLMQSLPNLRCSTHQLQLPPNGLHQHQGQALAGTPKSLRLNRMMVSWYTASQFSLLQ